MIISYRLTTARESQGVFHGLSLFTCEDLVLPLLQLPTQAINAFLAALKRQEIDTDATRISVPGFEGEQALTRLNTAYESALRAIPERYRPACRLFSAALSSDRRVLYLNTPTWLRIYAETLSGDIYEMLPAALAKSSWQRIPLQENELYLHFTSFGDKQPIPRINPASMPSEACFRSGDIFIAAKSQSLLPCISLRVESLTS